MTLSRLLEQAIVNDLSKDSRISQFLIQVHDNPGAKSGDQSTGGNPAQFVITVSAVEGQEVFGTGIKRMQVRVELRCSISEDPTVGTQLDEVEFAVSARLQPSYTSTDVNGNIVNGREPDFSGPHHKVFGITADGVDRNESNLERIRIVKRTFIAGLLR